MARMRVEIESMITAYGLGGTVRLTGWISGEQVKQEILASRAMNCSACAEGLPVVIMEAMALRRPVISTYVAGIPELIIPGQHGWLIPAGDIDALVVALLELFTTPEDKWIEMGEAAHARVAARHNIDTEAQKLLKLFKQHMNP